MDSYSKAAVEPVMKVQEVILRATWQRRSPGGRQPRLSSAMQMTVRAARQPSAAITIYVQARKILHRRELVSTAQLTANTGR